MALQILGTPGPSLPISIRGWRNRQPRPASKADPVWDQQFTTKFARKPEEDAPLATPIGAAKVVQDFLDRVEEINWLAQTQHQELPTTLSEMKANGIDGFSLSAAADDDMDAANIAASHLRQTPFAVRLPDETIVDPDTGEPVSVPRYADMVYAANMARRIDWERYIYACGPVHRVRFTQMRDGSLGIEYEGKDKDPETVLAHKRHMKSRWLASHEALPRWEDIANEKARHAHYGKPVLATMSDSEYDEYRKSRMFGSEDPDPLRAEFHAEDLRGKEDVGYAGPRGLLGIADDDDEPSSFWGEDDSRTEE